MTYYTTNYNKKEQKMLDDNEYIEYCLGCYLQEPQIYCTDVGRYCKKCDEPVNYLRQKDIKSMLGGKMIRKGFTEGGDLLEDL